jgi:hypothetical protein
MALASLASPVEQPSADEDTTVVLPRIVRLGLFRPAQPVFFDASGRRRHRIRWAAYVACAVVVAYLGLLAAGLTGGWAGTFPGLPFADPPPPASHALAGPPVPRKAAPQPRAVPPPAARPAAAARAETASPQASADPAAPAVSVTPSPAAPVASPVPSPSGAGSLPAASPPSGAPAPPAVIASDPPVATVPGHKAPPGKLGQWLRKLFPPGAKPKGRAAPPPLIPPALTPPAIAPPAAPAP